MTIDVYDDTENKYYKFSCPADAYRFRDECPEHRVIRSHLAGLRVFLDMLGVTY